MYFYELHEGDEDVFSDVVLARDDEMDPDEFFELVESVRHQVQDNFTDDTLIEAIAVELEREYGFVYVSDERLTLSTGHLLPEGVIKLSVGKKRHALLKPV